MKTNSKDNTPPEPLH